MKIEKKGFSFSIVFLFIAFIGCTESKKTDIKASEVENKLDNDVRDLCDVLDSVMRKTSSIPYNTLQGTPYLKIHESKVDSCISYRFFDDYPEMDEEGFDNGGKITLQSIIMPNVDFRVLEVESQKSKVIIDKKKIKKIRDGIFIVNLDDYFDKDSDPFYEGRIDFKINFIEVVKGNYYPILVGVYWENLEDYYQSNICE